LLVTLKEIRVIGTSDLDPKVRAAIASLHHAMAKVANGDISAITALYSHTADATSFFGWGGYERGWDGVAKRWDWAGQQFKGGTVGYRNVTTVVTPGMFFTTDIETYTDQRVAGIDGLTSWSNRVTHVFRLEDGEWRLVHRHANRLEQQFEPAKRLGAKT
jgi:ketosteroid isomerase-like protein